MKRNRGWAGWGRWIACGVLATVGLRGSEPRIEIAWPTPNRAYLEKKPIDAFIQPTESGEVTSGLFGCVRTSGTQFHEALDLFPLERDRRGEPLDAIFAVMGGVVRHINPVAGASSYGRYVVIEHVDTVPSIYTLYAHLSAIADGLKIGDRVTQTQVIATMGRSAGGYTIPKERAHLHFEMGVMLTERFQSWYDWKRFGSKNDHGLWNGMNLVGFDPMAFYDAFRERRVDNFRDFFRAQEAAVTVRVATTRVPDFVTRYPSLMTTLLPPGQVAGWDVKFNATGLPFAWTPLTKEEIGAQRTDTAQVVAVDEAAVKACRCKDLVKWRGSKAETDRDMNTLLQLLFGLRK